MPMCSTISSYCTLRTVITFSPMWGKYMYIFSPSKPQHLIGWLLGIFPILYIILGYLEVGFLWELFVKKWWLSPLFPFLHLIFLLVLQSHLKSWYSYMMIIEEFISPYDFLQHLGIIILYLITEKFMASHSSTFEFLPVHPWWNQHTLAVPNILSYLSMVILPILSSKKYLTFLS
jgi:hypothetical protein